jgi:hypothetical protein
VSGHVLLAGNGDGDFPRIALGRYSNLTNLTVISITLLSTDLDTRRYCNLVTICTDRSQRADIFVKRLEALESSLHKMKHNIRNYTPADPIIGLHKSTGVSTGSSGSVNNITSRQGQGQGQGQSHGQAPIHHIVYASSQRPLPPLPQHPHRPSPSTAPAAPDTSTHSQQASEEGQEEDEEYVEDEGEIELDEPEEYVDDGGVLEMSEDEDDMSADDDDDTVPGARYQQQQQHQLEHDQQPEETSGDVEIDGQFGDVLQYEDNSGDADADMLYVYGDAGDYVDDSGELERIMGQLQDD